MSDVTWYVEDDILTHDDLPELVVYGFTDPLPTVWWSVEAHELTTDILTSPNDDPYKKYPYPLGTWYLDDNDNLVHSALASPVGGEWIDEDDYLDKNIPDICKEYEDCNPYLTEATPSIVNDDIYGDKASWIPFFNSENPDSLNPENDYYVCNFSPSSQVAHDIYKGRLGYAVGFFQNRPRGVMKYGDIIDKSIGWSALGDYHPLATQFIMRCKCNAGGAEGRITDSIEGGTIFVETRDKVDYFLGGNSPTAGFGNEAPNQVIYEKKWGSNDNGMPFYLWGYQGFEWDYRSGYEYIAPIHMMPFIQMPLHNMLFQIRVQAIDNRLTVENANFSTNKIDVALEEYVDSSEQNSYVNYPYIVRVYMRHYSCSNESNLAQHHWGQHGVIHHVGITSETHLYDIEPPTEIEESSFPEVDPSIGCSNPSQVMFRGGVVLMGLMSGIGDNCIIEPKRSWNKGAEVQSLADPSDDGYFVTKYPRPTDPDEPEPWSTNMVYLWYDSEEHYHYHVALVAAQEYWPEFYEDCIRAAAGFGVFFTPNTTVDGLALDDDDVFLGILDDNWIGHGEFSRGVINHAQKQWTMKTTRDSYYMSVEKGAFYNCSNLDSIRIQDSVGIIGPYAFKGTALTNVTIPEKCVFYPQTFPEDCQINIRPRPVESEDDNA